MKVAFVGKGGSGKSTLSALFSLDRAQHSEEVLAIDADLNMHLPELFGMDAVPVSLHISEPGVATAIKDHLRGTNDRIASVSHFKKTTPPGEGSNLITFSSTDPILSSYTVVNDNVRLMTVGTYQEDGIGASCYHNNLAVLENVLSHTVSGDSWVVVDMVAGVDAFASSLHAQFDLTIFVLEPTRRSAEVFKQYQELATESKTADRLRVVANKVTSEAEVAFVREVVPAALLIGTIGSDEHISAHDLTGGALDSRQLTSDYQIVLQDIAAAAHTLAADPDDRLPYLYQLHERYVQQPYVVRAVGDLTHQIDPQFSYRQVQT